MINIKDVTAFEGEAVEYRGDDGWPAGHIVPGVVATDFQGREWGLPNRFWTEHDEDGFGPYPRTTYDLARAHEIAEVVHRRGFINEEHWVELEPAESLEDRLDAEWEREQMERMGLAA